MNVYMDDQRSCPFGYVSATTVECALQMVRDYDVNILSLIIIWAGEQKMD